LPSNLRDNVIFAEPTTDGERATVADACVRKLDIKIPALLDTIDNATEGAYTGWPDRLYLIDKTGRVVFKTKPGPFGFKVPPLEQALRANL
jgi:type I thyroxine 5'-deiodinase